MKVHIVTASAGSGKTTRLSEVLDEAIASGEARPEAIVATTFTKEAAAELIERARARLLAGGRGREAHQLLTARIGTVNSVCGALVTELAFELGMSPALRVLDESAAELEQKRALAHVVAPALSEELSSYRHRFERELDWRLEVRAIIEAGRANGLGPEELAASGERSVATLEACLGAPEADGDAIDRALRRAIEAAVPAIDPLVDSTQATGRYLQTMHDVRQALARPTRRWGDWAKLCGETGRKSEAAVIAVQAAAARHLGHPRLHAEMARFIRLLFQIAAGGLAAYQRHKRERGMIDFVDQEALALELLRRDDVRAALEGQLDLVLVDEFQDTSPLQLAIFLELARLARRSVWVGDQKQAIYGFRGTDPALMDAVIESFTATTNDPELVRAAVEAVGTQSTFESLAVSYRSRPELVELTNEIFARAFASQGILEERTRLRPALEEEPPDLGPIVEHWPLSCPDRTKVDQLAAAVAAGVRDLLGREPRVRDRRDGEPRVARPGDVAVLCRTNEQCRLVAEALAALGVAAVVPRVGLLDTAEAQVVSAGLRLWVDPRDAVAAAELARLVTYASDLDGLVARAISVPGREAFAGDPLVAAVLAARTATPDLGPVDALGAVIDATGLRELCAAWGGTAQRLANLDALRAHAVAYVHEAEAARDAPSLVGLLRALDEMVDDWGWGKSRGDRQALAGGDDAVTVSTWHRAKGREWPLVVLYGLESLREPVPFGLHVGGADVFDVARPLAGRWLRYWPNPYTTSNQKGRVRDAMEASPAFLEVRTRSRREALRLLYVGWTRARDRIILAAAEGKLTKGLFGTLRELDASLFHEPLGVRATAREASWAGRKVNVNVVPAIAAAPAPAPVEPGEISLGRAASAYAPARHTPSTAAAVVCELGQPLVLGPRLEVRGDPEMTLLGRAVHGFLAADRPEHDEEARRALAARLLARFRVDESIDAGDVVAAATRLWSWLERTFAPSRLHREWPVAEKLPTGTVVAGTADLVVRAPGGFALIDHKTFPGTLEAALERLPSYAGQLAAYAHAIEAATGETLLSSWIHLPVLGVVVELRRP